MKLFRNYFKKPVAVKPIQSVATEEQTGKEEEYTFDVVGESFQRDHLVALIKKPIHSICRQFLLPPSFISNIAFFPSTNLGSTFIS
jgi:hypothetical protein